MATETAKVIFQNAVKNHKVFRSLAEPLFSLMDLKEITCHTIDECNQIRHVRSSPEWALRNISNSVITKIHYYEPTIVLPKNMGEGFMLSTEIPDERNRIIVSELIKSSRTSRDWGQIAFFVRKDTVDSYFMTALFSKNVTDTENGFLFNILNNIGYINEFIDYLNDEFRALKKKVEPVSVFNLRDKNGYLTEAGIISPDFCNLRRKNILSVIKKSWLNDIYLSCQQNRCLRYLGTGDTAKDIGKKMNLSSRTVEFYINNLKTKLRCSSKKELTHIAVELKKYAINLNVK